MGQFYARVRETGRELTDERVILLEELKQLRLIREEDSLERGVRENPLGELPHARVRPRVVDDEETADHAGEMALEQIHEEGEELDFLLDEAVSSLGRK